MSNVADCIQCKYLKAISISGDSTKIYSNNKVEIKRDCAKHVKEIPYILVELNPNIKQKISCKEFELGDKIMIDELNKDCDKNIKPPKYDELTEGYWDYFIFKRIITFLGNLFRKNKNAK